MYEITGVTAADIAPTALSGNLVVSANGTATLTVSAATDAIVGETDTISFVVRAGTVASNTVTTTVTDATPVPTLVVGPVASASEGGDAVVYTVTATGFSTGDELTYTITGVGANEISVPLTGTLVVNSSGVVSLPVTVLNDSTVGDVGSLVFTVSGRGVTSAPVTTTIVDTTAERGALLTTGADTLTGNVFTGNRELVPGTGFVNTIGDDDVLTGAGVNPTLNIQIGGSTDISDADEIQPTLIGIETVNVEWISNDQGSLNLADAQGLTTLNVTRITANNPDIVHRDLDSSVTTIGLANSTRGGSVGFEYQEEVLTGADDVLAVNIEDVRVARLEFNEGGDGGADEGFFFEEVNVATTGLNDIDSLEIQANGREDLLNGNVDGTTRQVLNFVVNGTPATGGLEINDLQASGVDEMSIVANARVNIARDPLAPLNPSNDGTSTGDLELLTISGAANVLIDGLDTSKQGDNTFDDDGNLTGTGVTLTVDASDLTGNLRLGVESPSDGNSSSDYAFRADKDLSVTSGSGDDEIRTYGALAGDISTGAGDDEVVIGADGNGFVEGVSTIDTGDGNNIVSTGTLGVTGTDSNIDDNEGYDDVRAAAIITGSGNDDVTVANLTSGQDWDNKVLTDGNADDLYVVVGASIATGAGNDSIGLSDSNAGVRIAEGALIDAGEGDDELSVSLDSDGDSEGSGSVVLAGDTDADLETVNDGTNDGTREVTRGEAADRLGAVVDLGAGEDVANFVEGASFDSNSSVIVGRDAELRSAETVNVVALDRITVTSVTSVVDQDPVTAGVQRDVNANIIGTETLNITILNQIDGNTAANSNLAQNDNNEAGAIVTADILRFDSALATVNLVSEEEPVLLNAATELFEAGTLTNFELYNMREDIALTLEAQEATGVVDSEGNPANRGGLQDDSLLVIDHVTGEVSGDDGAAADVRLYIDYDGARANDNSASLTVAATSGAFDLDLTIGATTTDLAATNAEGDDGNEASTTDDDQRQIENFSVTFLDSNSHSVNANGFGDVVFRGLNDRPPAKDRDDTRNDVSSTASTSFTVQSAAGAGKSIALDAVNADVISFENLDGGVTAANVTLRVDASNNYTITTGTGSDIVDLRDDDVRSDDNRSSVNRADRINLGTGRDAIVVNGSDALGANDRIETGVPSAIIDDDVFSTLVGIEKIIVDADHNGGAGNGSEVTRITLDEQARATGVDTIAVVGSQDQELNLVVGNNFVVATVAGDNANGQLTSASSALVIDASLNTGLTTLNIESKDDDTDVQVVNLDVRIDSDGGADLTFVNTGDPDAVTEVRIFTADENDSLFVSSFYGFNPSVDDQSNDGVVDIDVLSGNIDRIVILDSDEQDPTVTEGSGLVQIDGAWTADSFELDASALLDTDEDIGTGGLSIVAAQGDTANLTISGTQNSDAIRGGRGSDTLSGNDGDDAIEGDEFAIVRQQVNVLTLGAAALFNAGDVITVSYDGVDYEVVVQADGTAASVAAQIAVDLAAHVGANSPGTVVAAAGNTVTFTAGFFGVSTVLLASIDNVTPGNANVVFTSVATSERLIVGGADVIDGGKGDDRIAGLLGADVLDGGEGIDTLDYSANLTGVQVSLVAGDASGGDATGDRFTNFENIIGSDYGDVLVGDDTRNVLTGGNGADRIVGGGGNDEINVGSVFEDRFQDTVVFASGGGTDNVLGFTSDGNEEMVSGGVAASDKIEFSDFDSARDTDTTTLLQQTGSNTNAVIVGDNTELLIVQAAALSGLGSIQDQLAAALDAAFDVTNLDEGQVVFSVQTADGSSFVGYYTHVDSSQGGEAGEVVGGDIEVLGVINGALVGANDFWLPTAVAVAP